MNEAMDTGRVEAMLAPYPHGPLEVAIVRGRPRVKKRPVVTRYGNVYTPSRADEEALAATLWGKFSYIDGPAVAALLFYLPDRRVSDFDNYIKLAADALTKAGAWKDDNLARLGAWWIDYDKENPRTVIGLAPIVEKEDASEEHTRREDGGAIPGAAQ